MSNCHSYYFSQKQKKRELRKSITKIKSLLERYNSLNDSKLTAGNNVRGKLFAEIKTNLTSVNWDIQDLEETISNN